MLFKNALIKDIWIEIKNTFGRIAGLFAIVALGVAFYAGIGATGADMQLTGDVYFDEQNLNDIRIVSNYGLTDDDIRAIQSVSRVEAVFPTYTMDAQVVRDDTVIVKVHAIDAGAKTSERINKPVLKSGRLPEESGEMAVEQKFLWLTGCQIGETITLESGKKRDIRNELKTNRYKITGVVDSPYYVSKERGNGSIGGGAIDCFVIIPRESFASDVYSEAFITVEGAKELLCFGDEYADLIQAVTDELEELADEREDKRFIALTERAFALMDKEEEYLKRQLNAGRTDFISYTTLTLELNERRKRVYALPEPKWHVLDRDTNAGYSTFSEDSKKITSIGKVFPLIFFLVAALVALTTMTRMVEERRMEIGTLKSLGYGSFSIMAKYAVYALLPTLTGGVAGGLIGMRLFPSMILQAYNMLYTTPPALTPIRYDFWLAGIFMAVAGTSAATLAALLNELRVTPSMLMRPKAPKAGKRTFLERVPFVWSRLSFIVKVTIRNLLRYKKRFLMTIIGVAGCTSLLMAGFGLRDSISDVVGNQYSDIFHYQMTTSFSDSVKASDVDGVLQMLNASRSVGNNAVYSHEALDAGDSDDAKESATIIVPENLTDFASFITLRERQTHNPLTIEEDGVIITEKLADIHGLQVNDTLYLKDSDGNVFTAGITGITENYTWHYIYMSEACYTRIFNEKPEYNGIFSMIGTAMKKENDALASDILDKKNVSYVSFTQSTIDTFADIVDNLNFVVFVLIASAAALAFVVLLNLTNININERIRELATIEVLGFYDNEVSSYIFRENAALTLFGVAAGLVMGVFLHAYIISTVGTNLMMFGEKIKPLSYLYSIILTVSFSLCVNVITKGKLKKINMVEALKSVE